ncbi:XrtB/PEP-CTERM-associated transcriptional regulator EpsA [Methylotenera mobilis]|uniref:Transcriptional regulator, LuxR family n=1 Tax=Methylotenera mobilis (strain JLW8 / ATCC BAA-1282 / DSM 17540) TaxID=583345 RepID=C6WXQ5_METML|nr:XrtB/PEP-CTERM-associated transcriptional regulator EpsA [Methylotenera mobilis]ACT48704.1 transcriptional regulator, LuxR family [Methylotenera mobilis JLW8]
MDTGLILSDRRHGDLNTLMYQCLHLNSHLDLMLWLQGDLFQRFVKHEVMIAAWGDFTLGILYVDIVSLLPGVRTGKVTSTDLTNLMTDLFQYWKHHSKAPITMNVDKGIFHDHQIAHHEANINLSTMQSAHIHGIKDLRGGHDCLYVFLSSETNNSSNYKKSLTMLLPFIDNSLRQLEHLPEQLPEVEPEKTIDDNQVTGILSEREISIMEWVKAGKTNQEIGIILDISSFTVKNHMQRILKKLDVLNRAQAVTQFNRMYQTQ